MTPTDIEGAGIAQLKRARKEPAKPPAKPTALVTASQDAPRIDSVMAPYFNRNGTLLFDPHESPPVVQSSGVVTEGADLSDRYEAAPEDFTELIVPENCKSSVAIKRWSKGDLVRKDIIAAWREKYGKTEDE